MTKQTLAKARYAAAVPFAVVTWALACVGLYLLAVATAIAGVRPKSRDELDNLELRAITARRMARYPHASPAPTTVDAFAKGYWSVLDVSNARPAAYANEPWTLQSATYHLHHAADHVAAAHAYVEGYGSGEWFDRSDGTPNLAHAVARCFFAMAQHDRG